MAKSKEVGRDSAERSEPVRDVEVERICLEPAINGYILEIKYPDKTEKIILGNARVMMHLLAGLLGYDLEVSKMIPKKTTEGDEKSEGRTNRYTLDR